MEDKTINQKEYSFQEKVFKLKKRSLKVRKDTYLLLNEFMQYIKEFGDTNEETLSIALMTYLSDEDKLKDLFSKCLDGEVEKINYDAEEDEKYMELLTFASSVFTDFFSSTLLLPNKTSK